MNRRVEKRGPETREESILLLTVVLNRGHVVILGSGPSLLCHPPGSLAMENRPFLQVRRRPALPSTVSHRDLGVSIAGINNTWTGYGGSQS
jgi:hypothetical protein